VPDSGPDAFDLTGRVALLTGGAGLLGQQFTRTLLRAGACVAVADLRGEAAAATAERIGQGNERCLGVPLDVTSRSSIESVRDTLLDRWRRIDLLINNAAIDPKFDAAVAGQQASTFEDYPLELWKQSLEVNLTGVFLCCQVIGKVMAAQGRGTIINISSTYGVAAPDQRLYQRDGEAEQTLFKPAAYAVTKAGVAHFTRYLATYWAAKGIRVNTLTPHGIYNAQDEQFVKRFADRSPLGRMAEPDEMNGALLFLASDASSYMTGGNLVVDGGWTAW
jgi:2-deoxy-D-gluconate 3-dehydrogenase